MAAANHPAYHEELDRLRYTLMYVEKSLERMLTQKDKIDEKVATTRRHMSYESSQEYIDYIINSMFQDRIALRLYNLNTARSRPYFARIDFKEGSQKKPEKLYIGKMALIRDEDQELVIVDWRAPIANLYYEGRLGDASYMCPDGSVNGNLLLKRQFSIDEGKLNEIFDIDITTNDEFLQSYLGASADNRLKDIVSTIQVEQNSVIRADMWTPLIVQGAAGSGKTTIALHRIAYLIYTYEKSFKPENFMIIAPNRLFLNYISEVLPELGVNLVKQTTFEDFAMELIGKKFKFRDENEKLVSFSNHHIKTEEKQKNELIRRESELKSSFAFKEIIDEYVKVIEKNFIPVQDFAIGNVPVFTYQEINEMFISSYKDLPLMKRVDEIKKHLTNSLKRKKDYIIERLQYTCDRKVDKYKRTMEDNEERHKLIIEAIDYKNDTISKVQVYCKTAVKEYITRISRIDIFKYYKDLFENEENFLRFSEGKEDIEVLKFTRDYSLNNFASGFIELEDLAPLIYLKYSIYGMDEKIPVKHIVIDEAQDFNVFQFYVLKKIVKDSSFTILGDLCQGIHSYRGMQSWEDLERYVFTEGRSRFLNLEQSYRTTVEIMEAANSVILKLNDKSLPTGKPVIRHGEKVEKEIKNNFKDITEEIAEKIKEYKDKGFKSMAIICKTMDECEKLKAAFKNKKEAPYIINGKEKEYRSGIVIVPSYLAKGLEFDVVFIANASEDEYKVEPLDAKLLYVAMTRPLHKLYVYYVDKPSPLIVDI